jgi:gas vesicle protein
MSTRTTDTTTNSGTGNTGTGSTGGSDTGSSSGVAGRVKDTAGAARTRAADAYSSARERTGALFGGAKDRASSVGQSIPQRIESSPVAAIVGGIALGGVLALLLPRSQRETEALGSVGHKLTDTAKEAARSAVEAGKQQVNELKETAASKVGHAVMDAVSSTTGTTNT